MLKIYLLRVQFQEKEDKLKSIERQNEKEVSKKSREIEKQTEKEIKAFKDGLPDKLEKVADLLVKTVLNVESEEAKTKPIIVVSSGGGYYVQGRVGEFDLERIKVGQKVNVQAFESGASNQGTIEKIAEIRKERIGGLVMKLTCMKPVRVIK